jgi:hypothetical protein
MPTDKLQGTCSVCLRPMQLHDDRPIRHGFSAVGVRHGQHGGYHTGPCAGTQFPHLGISAEGTQWALDRERKIVKLTIEALAKLATNPDLTWYPKIYDVRGGRSDFSNPIVVKYGDVQQPISNGAPSYAYLHRGEKAKLDVQLSAAEHAIAAYERVLASWSPEKYPVTGAKAKVETVHMEMPRRNSRGETWTGISCRFSRPGSASNLLAKTNDPAKVTCKRCRTKLGLPTL